MAETPQTVVLRIRGTPTEPRLPAALTGASRAAGENEPDPFLPANYLRAVTAIDVGGTSRGDEPAAAQERRAAPDEVVVLELADGGVLITSASRLRASLERANPGAIGADGALLLDQLADGRSASRSVAGAIGSIVQRVFSVVAGEERDDIVEEALKSVADPLALGASWLGARALMAAIEHKVEQRIGRASGRLFAWDGRGRLAEATPAAGKPALVFVHGTASSTQGSFGDLRDADASLWTELERSFGGGIYGFEHRTLSESPIENALQLATQLPEGADICLVTHSRGGLVGDLLCLDGNDAGFAAAIEGYRYALPHMGLADPADDQRVRREVDAAHEAQRAQLEQLRATLAARKLRIRRYVRVASPARGTLLAGANLDLFLSGLLSLVGQIPVLRASLLYSAFKRVVIEIAKRRTDPHVVPGIEAMLPDSPLAMLLRRAPARATEMALIAGDIEGGGLLKRLGTFLTDTLIFDREDNDLVVDTAAMLAGIAPRVGARLLFDRGETVSHFRYFVNPRTRRALRDWLLDGNAAATPFTALPQPGQRPVFVPATSRSIEEDTRPIVVVLPGIMGSNLKVHGIDRVWFDPVDLFNGGLARIGWGVPEVEPDGLFDSFYGDLCRVLERTHRVEPFPYDWRLPLGQLGEQLCTRLRTLAAASGSRPVRLLAHSMGGLVVRAAFHTDAALMDGLMSRTGARLVMCGTPHQGSHSMVENLVGKGDMLRKLVLLDRKHDLQQVLDLVAGFRGALALLPKPGFRDTFQGQDDGGELHDYQSPSTWRDLRGSVFDFWFGDGRVGQPLPDALDEASWLWTKDGSGRPQLPGKHRTKIVYVAGVGRNTPCGVRRDARGRLKMVGTARGDGTVTWDSGRIDGIGSFYYMPRTEHGSLLSNDEHFASLVELLTEGRTTRLETTAPAVRALEAEAPLLYDAAQPTVDDPAAMARSALGAGLDEQLPPAARHPLSVGVRAMDLRFAEAPILVGHYQDDPIAGAEALIDSELLNGMLATRHDLGLYAGPLGTAVAVLMQPGPGGQRRGVVVAGLGPYDGTLSPANLTEAVRTGALRYLLHAQDVLGPEAPVPPLCALLMGFNSSTSISIAASVEALVCGVVEANARFQQGTRRPGGITRLDIIEVFRDTAISACHALRQQDQRLVEYAASQGCTLSIRTELQQGDGVRQRLFDRGGSNYWPRFIVTGAWSNPEDAKTGRVPPDQIAFLHLGERARAEAQQQQRQPGQLEALVRSQIAARRWQPDFGRALFQLSVPHDFKETLRGVGQAVWVVDETTANLPWELMLADDPQRGPEESKPLAVRTKLVRKFQTEGYRRNVRQSVGRTALVIGNPSTDGFAEAFPAPDGRPPTQQPPPLLAAEKEAKTVADQLLRLGYEVDRCIGADQTHADVIVRLQRRAWRVVHVSAHGVFALRHRNGGLRTGVVLSDGFLLTAAEIHAMEVVPELVFLNCCHLGRLGDGPSTIGRDANLLAASIARELMDIGVRCVVVAGWAVTDTLAHVFGERFYEALLARGSSFGSAVYHARRAVWEADPGDITWGAFQAYGDPEWHAEQRVSAGGDMYAAPDEVLDALMRLRVEFSRRAAYFSSSERQRQLARVSHFVDERCPPQWREWADIQSAIGATWYALAEFGAARVAFLKALQQAGANLSAATRDIEQLASAETKLAERSGDVALVDQAIARLSDLDAAVRRDAVAVPNPERQSLLGSAWKVKATLLARQAVRGPLAKPQLAELAEALAQAARAYHAVTLPARDERFDAYPALNWLWLEVVGGRWQIMPRERAAEEADAVVEAVRRQVAADPSDVWKQIMTVESRLVAALVHQRHGAAELKRQVADYQQLFASTLFKPFHLEVVFGQMRRMALLLDAVAPSRRGKGGAAAREAAALLRQLEAKLAQGVAAKQ